MEISFFNGKDKLQVELPKELVWEDMAPLVHHYSKFSIGLWI